MIYRSLTFFPGAFTRNVSKDILIQNQIIDILSRGLHPQPLQGGPRRRLEGGRSHYSAGLVYSERDHQYSKTQNIISVT
jgi:hypothetical protein